MTISERMSGGVAIIDIKGRITAGEGAELLRDKINSLLHQGHRKLLLNLSGVDYLDSAGIQMLFRLREELRIRGQVLRLVIPGSSPANDALRLAGVARHVDTADTVDGALGEFA